MPLQDTPTESQLEAAQLVWMYLKRSRPDAVTVARQTINHLRECFPYSEVHAVFGYIGETEHWWVQIDGATVDCMGDELLKGRRMVVIDDADWLISNGHIKPPKI
jgi:hypothetical protein